MKTRLFHVIVICGAALSATAGCSSNRQSEEHAGFASLLGPDGRDPDPLDRCRLPDGSCNEHCRPVAASGECLDPCFVHTATCNPSCVKPDGSCGWPPTK